MSRTGVALVVLAIASPSRTALAEPDDMVAVDSPDLARPYPETCSNEGGIVGRRTCPPYGMWGAALESPYVLIRIGVNMRRLARASVPAKDSSIAAVSARSTTGSPLPPEAGSDDSYSIAESINIATSRISYIGFEVEISPTVDENLDAGARTFAAGAQLLFGLHGGTRLLNLGAELAAG